MDPKKFKEAYQRLESLDDRMSHKIRPRSRSMAGVTADQLEDKMQDLAKYTLEIKEVVRDLFLAIAAQPGSKAAKD
jgi:hypothetical protein